MMEFKVDGVVRTVQLNGSIMAGYTGRNQEAVQKHIDELRELGVPAPDRVPTLYPVSAYLIRTEPVVEVIGGRTSGEGEAVLISDGDDWLVGVGSDHTDRQLEETSIPKSKQVAAKPISSDLWRLSDVQAHWDELELRSWVIEGGKEHLYQEGRLEELLNPNDLLALIRKEGQTDLSGMAIYGGTLPLIGGQFRFGNGFAVELWDPRKERRLRCAYSVKQLV